MKLLKHLLLAITLIVTAICTASAQKGMSGIGVNVGFDYYIFESSLLNKWAIKYQYNFSNYYRIEPVISYSYTLVESDENLNPTSFEIGINNLPNESKTLPTLCNSWYRLYASNL